MKKLIWVFGNLCLLFIYADGVIGITEFPYLNIVMWVVTVLIAGLNLAYAGAMFFLLGILPKVDVHQKEIKRVYENELTFPRLNVLIDTSIFLFLLVHGYAWMSLVCLIGMMGMGLGLYFKDIFRKNYEIKMFEEG